MIKGKKKSAFINIKAMLMMLIMMFVGFGVFGGNVFANTIEPVYDESTNTYTYNITENASTGYNGNLQSIPVDSNKNYVINISPGVTVDFSSYGGLLYSNWSDTNSIENINITINSNNATIVSDEVFRNQMGVKNSTITYNFNGGTINGNFRPFTTSSDGSATFENCNLNLNLDNVTVTNGFNLASIDYTDPEYDYWQKFTDNHINFTIKGGTTIGGDVNLFNSMCGTSASEGWEISQGTPNSYDNGYGIVKNNTVTFNGTGGTINGKINKLTGKFYEVDNNNLILENTATNFPNYATEEAKNTMLRSNVTGWKMGKVPVPSPSETASTGTGTDNADGTVTVQIPITKLMHMNAADATILNDYTFTMTPADAVHTQDSYSGATSPAQTDNTVTIHKEAFNRITELNSNNNKVVISNVNNNGASGVDNDVFTLTFTNGQIGQFHYHVIETPITSGLQSGVTQDSTLYDIVVTIENKDPNNITSGEVKFAGVTMSTSTDNGTTWTKTNTGESTKSDRGGAGVDINNAKFTNTFHTADVLVDKTVRGSLGDKTKDFTFTFNVQGTNIPTTYKLYKTNAANETAEPVDVHDGSTFTLKHNESAKVMGLPEGASYKISETGNADYTTKIDATLGDSAFADNKYTMVNDTIVANNGTMYDNVAGQTGGENISLSNTDGENAAVRIAITSSSNLDEQHFTNMKGQLIPTGLIENMASFLGLALLAAFAVGYMLYKKKKNTVSEEA